MKILFLILSLISFSALGVERVQILKSGVVTNAAEFSTHAEAEAWVKKVEETNGFGKAAYKKEIKAAYVDEEGNHIPAVYEDVPAEYEVEYIDITIQKDQERVDAEVKKINKADRRKKLKEIDWTKVTTVASIRDLLKTVILEMEE
jgi:predicted secreted protein